MSQDPSDNATLHELLTRLTDGRLGPEQRAALRDLLARSEQARQYYVDFMILSANLRHHAAG